MANPFTTKTAGSSLMPGEWDVQQRQIDYDRRMAEQLGEDTAMPQGQMLGGIYVAPSWTQQLAKALNPMLARKRMESADERQRALDDKRMAERSQTLESFSKALRGTPEQVNYLQDGIAGPPQITPAVSGSRDAAMAELGKSRDPMLQQLYMAQMLKEPDKPVVVGRTLVDPRTGKQIAVDSTWQAEQQAALKARREIADQASADRRLIAGMMDARREQKNVPKLPTSALKMQQEELDAIGTSGTINADLKAIDKQIEDGKLNLGLTSNLTAKAKNFVGASDESSRNLASFQATLEKLRNDSLRLNKGVQTEGDAQRAWNELVANINDPKVVQQRLGEIQRINERAANLRRMNVDVIRSNFGVEPMDTEARANQPAAVGGGMPSIDAIEAEIARRQKGGR